MGITRAGGHVLTETGWVLDTGETDEEVSYSMSNSKEELLAAAEAAGLDVDESMKKAEILEALEA